MLGICRKVPTNKNFQFSPNTSKIAAMSNTSKPGVIYVTRDIERALGTRPSAKYHIVANSTPYAETIKKQYPDFVHLVESQRELLSTLELLKEEKVLELVNKLAAGIVVFKNNIQIEAVAKENGWKLWNPAAELAEKIENKVSQIEFLGSVGKEYLPETKIDKASNIKWTGEAHVLQWAHGHTGDSTILVNSEKILADLASKFPDRLARVSKFIKGPSFTLNVVLNGTTTLLENISYQITGALPFTDNIFATVGNDWSLPHSLLDENELALIGKMGHAITEKLRNAGWKGLFGIDIIRDDELHQIHLIEINARQPASTTFESLLQQENRNHGVVGDTTFEANLNALLGDCNTASIIPVNDGAQIIQRITKKTISISEDVPGSLELAGYQTVSYGNNTEYNSDLLRIQSTLGIMETHNKFNKRGKEIVDILTSN